MKPTITRILVPTDFSATSDAALDYAKTIARTFGASLHLLHVFEDPLLTSGFAGAYAPLPPEIRTALVGDAANQMVARLSTEERDRLNATTEVVSGTGPLAIVEYAKDNDIELIVMGTHGRTGLPHLFIGSVAERVVRLAPCPVLTVRGNASSVTQAQRAYVPEVVKPMPA